MSLHTCHLVNTCHYTPVTWLAHVTTHMSHDQHMSLHTCHMINTCHYTHVTWLTHVTTHLSQHG